MEYVNVTIEFEREKEEIEVRIIEEKETSAIVFIGLSYAHNIIENEQIYKKKPTIYFRKRLVKDYIRLPYENIYEDDEELGKICLFARAKYEFIF